MQNIDTILTSFINDIRTKYVIVSSTTISSTVVEYTLSKNAGFVTGDFVNINNSQYLPVLSFNNTTKKFRVESATKINSGFIQVNPIFYFYGKENEITNKFDRYQKDTILKYKVFPFVWRVSPTTVTKEPNEASESEYVLDLIIGTRCEPTKDTDYTTTNVIIPKLRPIYENLIKNIKTNKYFTLKIQKGEILQHEYTEEILSRDEQNITSQFLAAIVIRGLRLKTNIIKNC